MKQILQAGFLGSCVLAGWLLCCFYWIPENWALTKRAPFETTFSASISEQIKEEGVYLIPYAPIGRSLLDTEASSFSMQLFFKNKEHKNIAFVLLQVFIHALVCSFLLASICFASKDAFPRYGQRFFYAILVGLVGTVCSLGLGPVWLGHPWGYYLGLLAIQFVGWILLGALFALWFQPKFRGIESLS